MVYPWHPVAFPSLSLQGRCNWCCCGCYDCYTCLTLGDNWWRWLPFLVKSAPPHVCMSATRRVRIIANSKNYRKLSLLSSHMVYNVCHDVSMFVTHGVLKGSPRLCTTRTRCHCDRVIGKCVFLLFILSAYAYK